MNNMFENLKKIIGMGDDYEDEYEIGRASCRERV